MGKALVVFSGGQDSTTCLYWAKEAFDDVLALNIDYGQRHSVEIAAAEKIAQMAEVELIKMDIDVFKQIGDSALVTPGDISTNHRSTADLPASFVPGRNILLLTIAAAVAYKHGIHDLVTGVCQTDYSGYPDCRDNTIQSLASTLTQGLDYSINIHTPLMWKTKAETVKLAYNLPGCFTALAYSHTCYEGQIPPCGDCPSCKIRAKGFEEAGIDDPLVVRLQGA